MKSVLPLHLATGQQCRGRVIIAGHRVRAARADLKLSLNRSGQATLLEPPLPIKRRKRTNWLMEQRFSQGPH
jgi:hypothetical protein